MAPRLVDLWLQRDLHDDPLVTAWKLYASRFRDERGDCLSKLCHPDEQVQLALAPGTWFLRAVPVRRDVETPWELARVTECVVGTARAPVQPPSAPAINAVRPGAGLRVSFDPPAGDNDDQDIEVIEGPDVYRGKLIGVIRAASFLNPRERLFHPRMPGPIIPAEGSGQSFTRKVLLRPVGHGGGYGSVVSADLPIPHHHDTEVLTLFEINGVTNTGFVAPVTADPFEIVATDGVRLKEFPTWDALNSDWGTWDSGLFAGETYGAFFCRSGILLSNVHDFGATMEFQLSILDQFQRKSSAAKAPASWDVDGYLAEPSMVRDGNSSVTDELFFHHEHVTWDGKPLRPLAAPRWEYELDQSGTWRPFDPEAVLVANKVRVRCLLRETTGCFQLISPRIIVKALIPRFRYQRDNGVYPAGAAQYVVPLVNHPTTGATPWPNEMVVKVTPMVVPIAAAVIAKAPLANPPTFTVAMWDTNTGLPPVPAIDFMYEVSGY